ncbi:MAG: hypothetical protein R2850_03900 [Bacteroidia bacterium]
MLYLDYLGRDDYDSIADTLYNEMFFAGELMIWKNGNKFRFNLYRTTTSIWLV